MHAFYCATLLHSRSWLNCACRMVYGIYTETSVIGGISANREPSKVLSANLDGKVFGYNACPTRFSVLGLLNFERHLRPVVSAENMCLATAPPMLTLRPRRAWTTEYGRFGLHHFGERWGLERGCRFFRLGAFHIPGHGLACIAHRMPPDFGDKPFA